MHDSCMESYYADSLFKYIKTLENENDELKKDIAGADRFISRMEKLMAAQDDTIIAIGIQAAEAEDRADEEKRKRIALLMRR